jgi:hypothetical protein
MSLASGHPFTLSECQWGYKSCLLKTKTCHKLPLHFIEQICDRASQIGQHLLSKRGRGDLHNCLGLMLMGFGDAHHVAEEFKIILLFHIVKRATR